MHLHRQALARNLHGVKDCSQRDLGLKQILGSFNQQDVNTAFNQSQRLFDERLAHGVKADVAKRWQLSGGANGAGDEAWLVRSRKISRHFAGNLGGAFIDLVGFVLKVIFAEHNAGGAKGVGLNHVSPGFVIGGVDVFNNVRTAQDQQFVAAFVAPEIGRRRMALLNLGAHGAVIDNDTFANCFEERFHWLESRPTIQRVPATSLIIV